MVEIIIQTNKNGKQIALIENGKLIEYYEEDKEFKRREGNIYIGIVKDVIAGMQSAFVDIGTEKNSFIHIKDILPKVDETKETIKEDIDEDELKLKAIEQTELGKNEEIVEQKIIKKYDTEPYYVVVNGIENKTIGAFRGESFEYRF